ncbi:MAG: hypothetical protein A3A33_01420 [Candidatus Yanofskybacteria bacterium RIFCSPLOWO2_01_FULL_49_25]|uniref:Transglutaminase-like domain-containing protein n=1 Tax=Candidatus Yanofskybacteria bacterium RIFCSPLOWO2_01_FULL_49_25 TaxID=1802701 RepID=A0A1F8GZG7_9BACT|nr:MAG: hypothetical protein A3A33_01420 [Candidatus Yanofskybacteria bacterium RIFCSPLOWO2_01_FULL_49_25]
MQSNLSPLEHQILKKLFSPARIQDYLNTLPINFEPEGDTALSPRRVMREKRAHCAEGALLAAVALWYHGEPPLVLDLESSRHDFDHMVAVFRRRGHWGAIGKTNHAVLRYREPVYESIHELVMSFFHEYFTDDGKKTLRTYSDPIDLSKYKNQSWITSEKNIWPVVDFVIERPHYEIVSREMIAGFRKADPIERKAGRLVEWKSKR